MKKISVIFALLALMLGSCSTEAKYGEKATIDIQVKQVGAGFCEVCYIPSEVTWYYAGIIEISNGYNPAAANKKNFMNLTLDEAYMEYIIWRHEMLSAGVPFIADFASHALSYGDLDRFELYLKPGTDYLLYCYVVNPETNKPVGNLYTKQIRTLASSELSVHYDYRIKGQWDYVYPKNEHGVIVEDVPWIGFTRDEQEVAASGLSAKEFFTQLYNQQLSSKEGSVFRGMYAHNNNGFGDGTSSTLFQEGHTYYTAVMTFDGALSDLNLFKFTWTGPDMDLYLVPNK